MIARIWNGTTKPGRGDEFLDYLIEGGLQTIKDTPGHRATFLVRHNDEQNRSDYRLFTVWEDMDAITAFAGPNPEEAVYQDRDAELLEYLEPTVGHFEVVVHN